MRPILVFLLLSLILHLALLPAQYVLGVAIEPANVTPVPEPPAPGATPFDLPGTIPPVRPAAYMPLVFGGSGCSEDLFYACGGSAR